MMFAAIAVASIIIIIMSAEGAAQAHAETSHAVEGGVEIVISDPGVLVVGGRDGIVSILVKNGGWEDKQDISFEIATSGDGIKADPADVIVIGRLAEGGSYGEGISVHAIPDASPGTHYLNLRYTHVLVANNETPQEPFYYNVAIPIEVRQEATVVIWTQAPESIFAGAEFPITVEVSSEHADIRNVRITVTPPPGMDFLGGDTAHTLSRVQKGEPASVVSRFVTPIQQTPTEHNLPFEVSVSYVDDAGNEKEESRVISVVLRPKTFMELTPDGGIWLGDLFIAPYVSIGTIAGIPAGAIISILLKRKFGGSKDTKKSQQ